jgi:organic hydroperoxide reductase OsmC/OhrA
LIIRRIHVRYHLRLEADKRKAAGRAHEVHAANCPVARSIGGCIAITTSLSMEDI